MTIERPEEFPEWGTNNDSLIKAPSIDKRKQGYAIDTSTGLPDIPSLKGENWFRNLVYKWIKYFDDKLSNSLSSINHISITENEKEVQPNIWTNLKSFTLPKGRWLFLISFRHTNFRVNQQNRSFSPVVISGISDVNGDLSTIPAINGNTRDGVITEAIENAKKVNGINNNLYYSNIAKEVTKIDGSFVENFSFTCVINAETDKEYFVKNIYLTYPDRELYKVFYQINAIKIG
ncbi:hypothetical protein [Silvanigrella sp.]|jgi:hypothetical protein|uniref:hypothetical protein n=1 Tax=Silvanigrella sp. TaxID=2024976 RepID=UPI0037CA9FE1